MTTIITFYDIVAKDPIDTWSPNPLKAKYCLGFKKLPYRTVRLEYPEIEGEFKKLGIPPTETVNGKPLYTSPSIIDESTGARISESYKIAEYLDKAYPDTPRLFPPGSEALQAAFYQQWNQSIIPLWSILLPWFPSVLRPPSVEYTRRRYEDLIVADFDSSDKARIEAFKKAKVIFDTLDDFYSKSSSSFIMGDTPVFSDLIVASMLHGIRVILGVGGIEWELLSTWHNGRWGDLLARLEVYSKSTN